jgi:hypothetical protein
VPHQHRPRQLQRGDPGAGKGFFQIDDGVHSVSNANKNLVVVSVVEICTLAKSEI